MCWNNCWSFCHKITGILLRRQNHSSAPSSHFPTPRQYPMWPPRQLSASTVLFWTPTLCFRPTPATLEPSTMRPWYWSCSRRRSRLYLARNCQHPVALLRGNPGDGRVGRTPQAQKVHSVHTQDAQCIIACCGEVAGDAHQPPAKRGKHGGAGKHWQQ